MFNCAVYHCSSQETGYTAFFILQGIARKGNIMEDFVYNKEKKRFYEAAHAYAGCVYERSLDRINDALRNIFRILHVKTGKEMIHLLTIIASLEGLLVIYLMAEDYTAIKGVSLALIITVSIYMGTWYKRDEWKE